MQLPTQFLQLLRWHCVWITAVILTAWQKSSVSSQPVEYTWPLYPTFYHLRPQKKKKREGFKSKKGSPYNPTVSPSAHKNWTPWKNKCAKLKRAISLLFQNTWDVCVSSGAKILERFLEWFREGFYIMCKIKERKNYTFKGNNNLSSLLTPQVWDWQRP